MITRDESPEYCDAVRRLNEAAFGQSDEADLIERLQNEGVVLGSYVAELSRQIVGHILFSRMTIETTAGPVPAVALAPMAVLPEHQREGIGGELIRYSLDRLHTRGEKEDRHCSRAPDILSSFWLFHRAHWGQ
jgi:putative acetyltransferase